MRSHHKVGNDEDTQVTNGLNWVDRGPVDEQWRSGQLMLSSCCRTPQNLSLVRIKLKSVQLHPAGYSIGAVSEPRGKDINLDSRARTIDIMSSAYKCGVRLKLSISDIMPAVYRMNRTGPWPDP